MRIKFKAIQIFKLLQYYAQRGGYCIDEKLSLFLNFISVFVVLDLCRLSPIVLNAFFKLSSCITFASLLHKKGRGGRLSKWGNKRARNAVREKRATAQLQSAAPEIWTQHVARTLLQDGWTLPSICLDPSLKCAWTLNNHSQLQCNCWTLPGP